MAIKVFTIHGERCDHCDLENDHPVFALTWKCPETGWVQLWLHKACIHSLLEKVDKLEVKAARKKAREAV